MTSHAWQDVVTNGKTTFETCAKCGLARLRTINGEYFFTRLDPQHAQCPSPYRESL